MKFLLAYLRTLLILKIALTAASNCSFALIGQFSLVYVHFTFMAGFWNNFQDHRGLSEQLLEPQTTIEAVTSFL
jgi:hypothetical protein